MQEIKRRRYRIDRHKEAVREVQEYLRELDGESGTIPALGVDGIYGEETREAVREFQAREGLSVTGETDAETWALLYVRYREARRRRETAALSLPPNAFPMRLGGSGGHVRLLQVLIRELLDTEGPTDGYFGKDTELAVRRLERRYLLPVTGEVSPALWEAMLADHGARVADFFRA